MKIEEIKECRDTREGFLQLCAEVQKHREIIERLLIQVVLITGQKFTEDALKELNE